MVIFEYFRYDIQIVKPNSIGYIWIFTAKNNCKWQFGFSTSNLNLVEDTKIKLSTTIPLKHAFQAISPPMLNPIMANAEDFLKNKLSTALSIPKFIN